ncbi:hypothetical protein BB560_006906 [Smittium megazygosporum]|uniref:TAP-C domain-containing protein n=1 Tax=Smittium megazygosporum TaxID=133381 RepID=A0A2T9Y0C3_9FUNG|nr:hypothetical protein BB560_006906 [Smittium megazygosporum]
MVPLSQEIRSAAEEESKRLILVSKLKEKESSGTNNQEPGKASLKDIVPVMPNFIDSPEIKDLAFGFISGFFSFYDNDRRSLRNVYDLNALFSINYDTSGFSYPRSSKNSRVVVSNIKASGPDSIVEKIISLPRTAHSPDSLVFDSWSVPLSGDGSISNVIMLVIHGSYTEVETDSKFMFDRTFILSQAPPGSMAVNIGWPCVISQDFLTIRINSVPEPVVSQPAVPIVPQVLTNIQPAPVSVGISPVNHQQVHVNLQQMPVNTQTQISNSIYTLEQNNLIGTLSNMTGLNSEWSAKCLAETGWDLNKSLEAFNYST